MNTSAPVETAAQNVPTGTAAATPSAVNIASRLRAMVQKYPHKRAVICPAGVDSAGRRSYAHLTFAELDQESDRYARGLIRIGVQRGMRTILLVRPGLEFFSLTFALFKIGAVPVLVDAGMGRRNLARCLSTVGAEAFIGIPIAHLLRLLHRSAFRGVKIAVTVGRRWFWGGWTHDAIRDSSDTVFDPAATTADETAAILFTSGSTGPAKGVVYTHGIFDTQVSYLESHYLYKPDEIDLATFPLFALFDAALGMTAVIPDMDSSRPGSADPKNIVAAISDHGCTHMFGSPALLRNLACHCDLNAIQLPTLRRIITAGAPIPPALLETLRRVVSNDCDIHTPYGATEALPISDIESRQILEESRFQTAFGAGTCVGKVLTGVDVRIIAIRDEPIARFADARLLPPGDIGEIVVKGPQVTREYFARPRDTAAAKMSDDAGGVWHRMGDVGYLDERNHLWFCGRKSHRVIASDAVLFTDPVEGVFNEHPRVFRSALVGVPPRDSMTGPAKLQTPVVCIELHEGDPGDALDELSRELCEMAASHEHTRAITTFLYPGAFPVDTRHNAKIFREKLAEWAMRQRIAC